MQIASSFQGIPFVAYICILSKKIGVLSAFAVNLFHPLCFILSMLRFFGFFLLVLSTINTFGGGFDLNLQGIRQQGMGHTGTGMLQGSSNLFFNPGSIGFQKGKFHVQGGANVSAFNAVYYDPVSGITARTKDRLLFPLSLYVDVKLTKWASIGMAIYDPYGTDVFWENDWKGRFLIQNVALKATNFQPTLSFKLGEHLGFGVGIVYSSGRAQFTRDIPVSDASGSRSFMELSGRTDGMGVNLGIFYQINEVWRAGASYRSGINYKVDRGQVDVSVPQAAKVFYPSKNTFSSELPSPDVFNFGVSAQCTKRFLIAADVNHQAWSVFKELNINFSKNTTELQDIRQIRNWKNTTSFRFGAQYLKSCCLSFRAGVAYEKSPVNKNFFFPDVPEADRFTFHAGFSYDFDDHWSVDLATILSEGKQVEGNYSPNDFRGVYKARTVVGSAGVSYVF